MDIFNWPDELRPAEVEWGLFVPQSGSRSTFDGSAQTQTIGPPRWWFSINTGALRFAEVPAWEAFIGRLRGAVNRVRAYDWRREQPLSPGGYGTPTVRVAGDGATLQTQGWTPSLPGALRAGSYIGLAGQLKRLSVTVNPGSDGLATIAFEPPTRGTIAADIPLVLVKPTALFMLTSERPGMAQRGARNPGATYTFEEDPR